MLKTPPRRAQAVLYRAPRRYRLALQESVKFIKDHMLLKLDQLPKETLFNLANTSADFECVQEYIRMCQGVLAWPTL